MILSIVFGYLCKALWFLVCAVSIAYMLVWIWTPYICPPTIDAMVFFTGVWNESVLLYPPLSRFSGRHMLRVSIEEQATLEFEFSTEQQEQCGNYRLIPTEEPQPLTRCSLPDQETAHFDLVMTNSNVTLQFKCTREPDETMLCSFQALRSETSTTRQYERLKRASSFSSKYTRRP